MPVPEATPAVGFPGEIAGASLKQLLVRETLVLGDGRIPRRNRRGLIEAALALPLRLAFPKDSPAKSPGPH